MWQAIAAAATSLNVSMTFNTGVIDARAFQGPQLVTFGVGTTALYGGNTVGSAAVNGVLVLGDVTNYCDGPSTGPPTGTYTDGSSNYGTPCIIVPWGYQIIGTTPLGATFTACGNPPPAPCMHSFPERSYSITGVTGTTGTQLTFKFANGTFVNNGGAGDVSKHLSRRYVLLATPKPNRCR